MLNLQLPKAAKIMSFLSWPKVQRSWWFGHNECNFQWNIQWCLEPYLEWIDEFEKHCSFGTLNLESIDSLPLNKPLKWLLWMTNCWWMNWPWWTKFGWKYPIDHSYWKISWMYSKHAKIHLQHCFAVPGFSSCPSTDSIELEAIVECSEGCSNQWPHWKRWDICSHHQWYQYSSKMHRNCLYIRSDQSI